MNQKECERLLIDTVSKITSVQSPFRLKAANRMDELLKPLGSLGRLESIAVQLAAIQGTDKPTADSKLSLIYAGDNGVTAEGISLSPPEATATMIQAFCDGKAGINILAARTGAKIRVVDVGVVTPYEVPEGVIVRRIRPGTGNIRKEPAMSRAEAFEAFAVGIETARNAIKETGAQVVGVGEVGIGNTTTAAALTAVFAECDVAYVTGRGTGMGKAGVAHKIQVIQDALKLHQPNPTDPVGAMALVGGLEIAAMCGAMLSAAAENCLILVDGFISGAAALTAAVLSPPIRERMLLSHRSAEPGQRVVASKLELLPLLDLGLRLGEGTGAAAAMPLVEASAAILSEMGTLEESMIVLKNPL